MPRIFTLFLLLLTVLSAGCVSTQKRYEKALDLEARGRHAEAAEYYIKVLRREPSWEEARTRLLDVGTRTVNTCLDQAEAAAHVENYEQAVAVLDRAASLRQRAADVGVLLPVPDDFAEYYEALRTGAIASLTTRGEQAEQAGDWPEALRSYERALQRYAMPPEQRAELDRARTRVHLRWGEQEMHREHHRAAYEQARRVLDILGPEGPFAAQAFRLQEAALAAGTRPVTFLPIGSTEQAVRETPRGLLQDLNDVLLYERWSAPPPFIVMTDPVEMHRALRRFPRGSRDRLSRDEAAAIGRALDAAFVAGGELTRFQYAETDLRERTRPARTRGRNGRDTTFVEQQFTLELSAEAAYYILDPYARSIVDQGSVRETVSGRLSRGVYGGDPRDLDLSTADLRLFDPEVQRLAEQELEGRLVEELADRFAARTYEALLRRIP